MKEIQIDELRAKYDEGYILARIDGDNFQFVKRSECGNICYSNEYIDWDKRKRSIEAYKKLAIFDAFVMEAKDITSYLGIDYSLLLDYMRKNG